jgi:hypothetical protein
MSGDSLSKMTSDTRPHLMSARSSAACGAGYGSRSPTGDAGGREEDPDEERRVSGIAHKRPSIRCVGASSRAIGTPCAHALAHGLAAQVRHGAAPGPSRAYSSRASVRSP